MKLGPLVQRRFAEGLHYRGMGQRSTGPYTDPYACVSEAAVIYVEDEWCFSLWRRILKLWPERTD